MDGWSLGTGYCLHFLSHMVTCHVHLTKWPKAGSWFNCSHCWAPAGCVCLSVDKKKRETQRPKLVTFVNLLEKKSQTVIPRDETDSSSSICLTKDCKIILLNKLIRKNEDGYQFHLNRKVVSLKIYNLTTHCEQYTLHVCSIFIFPQHSPKKSIKKGNYGSNNIFRLLKPFLYVNSL